jgi:PadR family transcriptional regulator, regulatory protein PadR
MKKQAQDRAELLQGTLDMLTGPTHGHAIAKHIQRTSDEMLQVEHGSLYPALHRLVKKNWISAKWEMSKERHREFKYYRLTPLGRKQLVRERSKWTQMAAAIHRVMDHAS